MRRIWRIPSESETHKLERGFMPNEYVMADAKHAFLVCAAFPLMLLDVYSASSMSQVVKKKAEAVEYMKEKRRTLLATMERKQKLMSEAPEEIRKRVLQDVMVLEDKFSEVKNELYQASEEMRKLTAERWKAEGTEVSATARVVLDGKAVSGGESSQGVVLSFGSFWIIKELRLGTKFVEQCSELAEKRTAVVRQESADTLEYEAYQKTTRTLTWTRASK